MIIHSLYVRLGCCQNICTCNSMPYYENPGFAVQLRCMVCTVLSVRLIAAVLCGLANCIILNYEMSGEVI